MYVFLVDKADQIDFGRLDPSEDNTTEYLHLIYMDENFDETYGEAWTSRINIEGLKRLKRFPSKEEFLQFMSKCELMK